MSILTIPKLTRPNKNLIKNKYFNNLILIFENSSTPNISNAANINSEKAKV